MNITIPNKPAFLVGEMDGENGAQIKNGSPSKWNSSKPRLGTSPPGLCASVALTCRQTYNARARRRHKDQKTNMIEKLQVWSCGGGRQSCAIGALIISGELPKPDIAVIADTGRETKSTWRYVDSTLAPALKSAGIELQRIAAEEWSYYHKKGHDVFNSKGTLQIPAYSDLGGDVSKLSGFCSTAWKKEPIERWLRDKGHAFKNVCTWIGYSKDEQRRWVKKYASKDYARGLLRFPLVFDRPTHSGECGKIVRRMGWPEPPKSRCWMCPNQNDKEWAELTPEELRDACEFEKEIQKRDPNAWLHRSCKPLASIDFSKAPEPDLLSRPCDSGLCFL